MTLKGKNRYTFVFSIFFLGVSILYLIYFILKMNSFYKGDFLFTNSSIEDFNQNKWSIIVAGMCLLVYIPMTAFYIYYHFIKTPSAEVIYFMLFLLGCTVELLRVLIPLEAIQSVFPEFLVVLGRALFWGRILCFSSLFASSIAGSPDQRVNAEQNIFIIVIATLTLANFVPVNTAQITNSYTVDVGMKNLLILFSVVAVALTFATYAIQAWQNESKNHILLGLYVITIQAGFVLLNYSITMFTVLLGAFFLVAGTFLYLSQLHKLYA